MKIYNLKCPQCSEIIEYELDRTSMFCKYCGKELFKNEITLDKVISEKEQGKEEAQEYYERWLALYDSYYSNLRDYKIQKVFNDFDNEYRIKFPKDYRRMYCDVLLLTQSFKGIEIFSSTEVFHSEQDDVDFYNKYVDTWIRYGGMGKKDKIVELQCKIKKASKDTQAIEMVRRIQQHIDEVMKVAESQIVSKIDLAPGQHVSSNLIKRELREDTNKKGLMKKFGFNK